VIVEKRMKGCASGEMSGEMFLEKRIRVRLAPFFQFIFVVD